MSKLDAWIERVSPGWALQRSLSRLQLTEVNRAYDAAQVSNYRKNRTGNRASGDAVMYSAGAKLRNIARYLDENHDIAIGILDTLVNNIVGTRIQIQPMIRTKKGELATAANEIVRNIYRDWSRRPEVTRELSMAEVQRQICRSWLRDGEVLVQDLLGTRRDLRHATGIPYSVELVEADFLPFELNGQRPLVIHGVEKDAWGRPVAYYLYRDHPGNTLAPDLPFNGNTKRVSADRLRHIKFTRRIRQTRGVTIFHGVLNRLDDIKDYEESERIAARVASAFTAAIKKSASFQTPVGQTSGSRTMEMAPGMIFDNLLPGEDIVTIDSKRPNPALEPFRNGQLKATAAGTMTGYSSISRNYDGNYSAQRQELVESQPAYRRLQNYFIDSAIEPMHRNLIDAAILSGDLVLPRGVDMRSVYEASFRGDGIPWIDPEKEANADILLINNAIKSRRRIQRERGIDPDAEEKEIAEERQTLPPPVAAEGEPVTSPGAPASVPAAVNQ